MAIHAHKRGEESNDRLLHRWKKQVQDTGLLKTLRVRSHFVHKPNKRALRIRALKREAFRASNKKNQFYSNM